MEDNAIGKQESLENQLRSMILGNVKISAPDQLNLDPNPFTQQQPHEPKHHHGLRYNEDQMRQLRPEQSVIPEHGRPLAQADRNKGASHQTQINQTPQSSRFYAKPNHIVSGTRPSHHPLNTPVAAQSSLYYAGLPVRNPQTQQLAQNPIIMIDYLDHIASREVPRVEITRAELEEKELFRQNLEGILRKAVEVDSSINSAKIDLVGFGSLASGFGMQGSDMDLAIVLKSKPSVNAQDVGLDKKIPRLLEKAVLECKMGGRLLTRTRVPILKVCQKPTESLYVALCEERQKWDDLPEEQKYSTSKPKKKKEERLGFYLEETSYLDETSWPTLGKTPAPKTKSEANNAKGSGPGVEREGSRKSTSNGPKQSPSKKASLSSSETSSLPQQGVDEPKEDEAQGIKPQEDRPQKDKPQEDRPQEGKPKDDKPKEEKPRENKPYPRKPRQRGWTREKAMKPLDFPETGVGIQCDINFSNALGIHNTHLLRCYSLCDPRVRPMVLFIKSWAKTRKINSSYSGTLSSYGWVLMVLHYLVHIVQPPVLPNLQMMWHPPLQIQTRRQYEELLRQTTVDGYAVRFWSDEAQIFHAAQSGTLTQNTASLGTLLLGFFNYFSSGPACSYPRHERNSFFWTVEVLSLRTEGGLRNKAEKKWTGAKTTMAGGKQVQNRYLFAIEDPFEIDHNVARTVTHPGIVAIRDEFRRAWNILSAVGRGEEPEGGLFDEIVVAEPADEKVKQKVEGMEDVQLDDGKNDAVAKEETRLDSAIAV